MYILGIVGCTDKLYWLLFVCMRDTGTGLGTTTASSMLKSSSLMSYRSCMSSRGGPLFTWEMLGDNGSLVKGDMDTDRMTGDWYCRHWLAGSPHYLRYIQGWILLWNMWWWQTCRHWGEWLWSLRSMWYRCGGWALFSLRYRLFWCHWRCRVLRFIKISGV